MGRSGVGHRSGRNGSSSNGIRWRTRTGAPWRDVPER
ncbi:hypothetical protein [Streptomyces sp. NPDC057582]